jgi:hypothetical protein
MYLVISILSSHLLPDAPNCLFAQGFPKIILNMTIFVHCFPCVLCNIRRQNRPTSLNQHKFRRKAQNTELPAIWSIPLPWYIKTFSLQLCFIITAHARHNSVRFWTVLICCFTIAKMAVHLLQYFLQFCHIGPWRATQLHYTTCMFLVTSEHKIYNSDISHILHYSALELLLWFTL